MSDADKPPRQKPKLDERYIRVPLAKLTTPRPGFLHCMTDHWWAVTDDEQVLFYRKIYHSPQCNTNKAVVEHIGPEGTTPRFVPVMFIPVRPEDYV